MSRACLFLPGPERVAQVLIHRCEADGTDGVLTTDGNQQILANETGFSMRTLAEAGLISREGRKILMSPQQYRGLKELVNKVMDPKALV